jgi:hypothetical protein
MHVPINIPSLSMSTHHDVDMNRELIAHGYANLLGTCKVLCFRWVLRVTAKYMHGPLHCCVSRTLFC